MSDASRSDLRALRARGALATQCYVILRQERRLEERGLRTWTYRCAAQRCALLHVFLTPHGVILGIPPYKLSPDQTNRTTSVAGRQKRTTDGERHWAPRASFVDDVGDHTSVTCDHVTARALAIADVMDEFASDAHPRETLIS